MPAGWTASFPRDVVLSSSSSSLPSQRHLDHDNITPATLDARFVSNLTDGQEQTIALLLGISSLISVVGSGLILRDLWSRRRSGVVHHKRAYGRILGC
eukprot:CAMPEP_0168855548 /NCGR_PEP_ID=MMETSP0727-20121128/14704_1 /TAXON_ID=265536 /ORGANISM="Amphiprora sp., Strain CCMP467" /LENGTH=97 /DNA_ID=CAMNT_0008910015 /DNA_START=51 /DNA_END=341 /DNA_ORIENTATION=-